MRADRGDAFLRASLKTRRKRSLKPLILVLVLAGIGATALMGKSVTQQIDQLVGAGLLGANSPQKIEVPKANADKFMGRVSSILSTGKERVLCATFKKEEEGLAGAVRQQNCKQGPAAAIEWAGPRQTRDDRQRVFNDDNYIPQTNVNTIRMPQPQSR